MQQRLRKVKVAANKSGTSQFLKITKINTGSWMGTLPIMFSVLFEQLVLFTALIYSIVFRI